MSAVELPQVASARSSSSRGSVTSVGSCASEKSTRSDRNQRNHSSVPLNNGSDEDEDQESDGDENEDDDHGDAEEEEPQESSGGIWDEVESFLNRPSPSLSVLAKPEKKSTTTANVLPTLRSDHQRRKQSSEPESQSAPRVSNRPARPLYQASSKPVMSSAAAAAKAIDPKLLQEAFAYAQKVAMMNFEDDQQEQAADVINDRHHPLGRSSSRSFSTSSSSSLSGKDAVGGDGGGSGPRAPSHGLLKKQTSSGVSAKGDEPKKKKSATKSSVYGTGAAKPVRKKSERRIKEAMQWDAASAAEAGSLESGGASRKNMDLQTMQSLVSNFQNGTTLDELRKELAASQQSMALSRQVLHEAAKSFFQPSR